MCLVWPQTILVTIWLPLVEKRLPQVKGTQPQKVLKHRKMEKAPCAWLPCNLWGINSLHSTKLSKYSAQNISIGHHDHTQVADVYSAPLHSCSDTWSLPTRECSLCSDIPQCDYSWYWWANVDPMGACVFVIWFKQFSGWILNLIRIFRVTSEFLRYDQGICNHCLFLVRGKKKREKEINSF